MSSAQRSNVSVSPCCPKMCQKKNSYHNWSWAVSSAEAPISKHRWKKKVGGAQAPFSQACRGERKLRIKFHLHFSFLIVHLYYHLRSNAHLWNNYWICVIMSCHVMWQACECSVFLSAIFGKYRKSIKKLTNQFALALWRNVKFPLPTVLVHR